MHVVCCRESGHPEGSSCPRICSLWHSQGLQPLSRGQNDGMNLNEFDDDEVLDLMERDDDCNDLEEVVETGDCVQPSAPGRCER